MKKRLILVVLCFSFCFISQSWGELDWESGTLVEQTVIPDNHVPDNNNKVYFGSSVALSDKYAIIGSTRDSQVINKGGAAFIYEKNEKEWILVKKVCDPELGEIDYLGVAVALSGDYAFAGALNHKDLGIVYVYQRQTSGEWKQTQKLIPDSIEGTNNFGCSLAAYNGQLIIGAYGTRDDAGKAFIFELVDNQWIETQCLQPEEPDIIVERLGGRFGEAVDISKDYAIIGTGFGFEGIGAFYIYKKQNNLWQKMTLIKNVSNTKFSYFGKSVAINEQYAVVGAYGENDDAGVVYVYRRDGDSWDLMSTTSLPDLIEEDFFGISVDLDGNIFAVGAKKVDWDVENSNYGAAYIFRIEENESCSLLKKFTANQPVQNGYFGANISITEKNILIGDGNSLSAYFYSLEPSSPFGPDGILGLDDVVHFLQILSGKNCR